MPYDEEALQNAKELQVQIDSKIVVKTNELNSEQNESPREQLKSLGLDHFIPELHNEFRRNTKSFEKATEAIHHIQNARLLSAITICVTKSFCTLENLEKYHLFAKEMNVPFVQLMEPRATGNYENMDVNLNREQLLILEDFYFFL
jgi:MoaA/NifB/PqqE/SkfB family radical SAM enzyme